MAADTISRCEDYKFYLKQLQSDSDNWSSILNQYITFLCKTVSKQLGIEAKLEQKPYVEEINGSYNEGNYESTPSQVWDTNHFIHYFEKRYSEYHPKSYRKSPRDYKLMNELIQEVGKDRSIIKHYIDNFMENEFFSVKSISVFTSSNAQTILDYYYVHKKFPTFMKENSSKKNSSTLKAKGDQDWLDGLE